MAFVIKRCPSVADLSSASISTTDARIFNTITPLLRVIGTDLFTHRLFESLNSALAFDRCTLVRANNEKGFILAASGNCQSASSTLSEAYVRSFMPLTPFVQTAASQAQTNGSPGAVILQGLDETGAVNRFFSPGFVVDRLSVAVVGDDYVSYLNLYRNCTAGFFSPHDVQLFAGMSDLLAALVDVQVRFASNPAHPPKLLHKWYSVLSDRERSVASLLRRGETAVNIARILGIAETSVVTYKKRALIKLGIRSQRELVRMNGLPD